MKIKRIGIAGFLSICGMDVIDLDRKGVTLVEGVNHDSTADSNGAGKSSIFEALHWGLYGSTRRGLTGDEVINRHGCSGTIVIVVFEAKEGLYTVIRTRKAKKGKAKMDMSLAGTYHWSVFEYEPTGLEVYLTHIVEGEDVRLTKGTVRDTQALLEGIIGLSQLAFGKMVYFGQGDVKPLAELADAELKMVFEQGLGLQDISAAHGPVTGYRKAKDCELVTLMGERKSNDLMLAKGEESRATIEAAIKEFEDRAEARVDDLKRRIEVELDTAKRAEASCDGLADFIAKEQKKQAELDHRLKTIAESEAEHRSVWDGYSKVIAADAKAMEMTAKEMEATKGRLARVRSSDAVGTQCDSCGLLMDEAALAATRSKIIGEYAALTKTGEGYRECIAVHSGNRRAVEEGLATIASTKNETVLTAAAVFRCISEAEAKLAAAKETVRASTASVDLLRTRLEAVRSERTESLWADLGKAQEFIRVCTEKKERLGGEIIEATIEVENAQRLESVLGNAGMKSMVFDAVTPELNTYANEALAVLDPGMSMEFSTVTTLKSGERREKFSVTAESGGAATFSGHSGGEKQKINLAGSLAFNTLMRRSGPSAPSILVLDEPFEGLDAGSSGQVMELLATLDVDNVFLITHNQAVKDLIPNRIVVEKRKGLSTIKG